MFSNDRPIILNVGCGESYVTKMIPYFKDWKEIRTDLYTDDADIKCDIVNLDGVPDSSVDCVFASHVVEHLYWHELSETFTNFMRVLKPNGIAIVIVPDLASIADRIKDNLLDPLTEYNGLSTLDFIYGGRYYHQRDGVGQLHKTGFTQKSMMHVLGSFGIKCCVKSERFQVHAVCFKGEVNTEVLNHI